MGISWISSPSAKGDEPSQGYVPGRGPYPNCQQVKLYHSRGRKAPAMKGATK